MVIHHEWRITKPSSGYCVTGLYHRMRAVCGSRGWLAASQSVALAKPWTNGVSRRATGSAAQRDTPFHVRPWLGFGYTIHNIADF